MSATTETLSVKTGFSLKEWIFTTDHKRVAVLYMIGSFAAFFVAGLMAMLMRTELASVGPTLTENPTNYNVWLYFHGAARILCKLLCSPDDRRKGCCLSEGQCIERVALLDGDCAGASHICNPGPP